MGSDLLIVDDVEEQLVLVKAVFSIVAPALKVETALGGDIALKILKEGNLPKVILLDLQMPGKSGQEVLTELKSDPKLKKIPVCIFSNADIPSEVCDCYARGANQYFKKPAGLNQLKLFMANFYGLWFTYVSYCPQ